MRGSLVGREQDALTGSSGRNLCKIAGWQWEDYLSMTERRNLFYVAVPDGTWRADLARVQAGYEAFEIAGRGIPVVLLGQKVRDAFQDFLKIEIPTYDWSVAGKVVQRGRKKYDVRFTVGHVPHPSGRNRMWNSSDNVNEARAFLQELIS